jgi:hypothetical protein
MFETIKAALYITILSLLGICIFYWCLSGQLRTEVGKKFIVFSIIIPVVSFASPNILLFNIIIFTLIPLVAKKRQYIAPVYIFSYLTLPFVDYLFSPGGIYIVTYSVGTSLGLGAILALFMRGSGSAKSSIVTDLPFLTLFLVLTFASARDTTATNTIRVVLDNLLSFGIPYFVISRSIRNWSDAKLALIGLIAATVVLSVIATYESLRAWPLYRVVWFHYNIPLTSGASVKLRGGLLRSAGPFPEPTSFAFCLCIGVIANLVIGNIFRSAAHRGLIAIITLLGILAPQSRGAWIGLAAGILAADLCRRRYAAVGRNLVILGIAGALVVAGATVSSRIADLAGLSPAGEGTIDYRSQLFDRGMDEIRKKPLIGDPPAVVLVKLRDLTQGEGIVDFVNAYIYLALISGLIGLGVIILALGGQLTLAWRIHERMGRTALERDLSAFVFAALVSMIIMLAFTSLGGRNMGMLVAMMAFTGTLANISRRPGSKLVLLPESSGVAVLHSTE